MRSITRMMISMPLSSKTESRSRGQGIASGLNYYPHREVIDHLNASAGKKYRVDAKTTKGLLDDLFSSGYTVNQIKDVIDHKVTEWENIAAMRTYLRPATLFDKHNFRRYLIESSQANSASFEIEDHE